MQDETREGLTGLQTLLETWHNWFVARGGKHAGTFTIASGVLDLPYLQTGQYYRIRGSVFNDGLHQFGNAEQLTDETFTGEVAALAIPRAVIALSEEIAEWRAKNPETDKVSESFGGYSYTRAGGQTGSASGGWQAVFASRMRTWRKPYEID